jgi:hypothetical protein
LLIKLYDSQISLFLLNLMQKYTVPEAFKARKTQEEGNTICQTLFANAVRLLAEMAALATTWAGPKLSYSMVC